MPQSQHIPDSWSAAFTFQLQEDEVPDMFMLFDQAVRVVRPRDRRHWHIGAPQPTPPQPTPAIAIKRRRRGSGSGTIYYGADITCPHEDCPWSRTLSRTRLTARHVWRHADGVLHDHVRTYHQPNLEENE